MLFRGWSSIIVPDRAVVPVRGVTAVLSKARRYGVYFAASSGERFVGSFGQLIVAPLFIDRLGVEGYGAIVLYNLSIGVASSLDVGMTPSVQRFVADDAGRDASLVLNAYASLVLLLGAVLVAGAASTMLIPVDAGVLPYALLGAAMLLVINLAVAGLRGAQLFVEAGNRMTVFRTIALVAMAVAALVGANLTQVLVVAILCSAIAAMVIFRHAMQRLNWRPSLRWNVARFRTRMLGFSMWAWGQRLLAFVALNADRILVSALLGPAALAIYNLAWSVSSGVSQLFSAGSVFVFPLAAARAGRLAEVHQLYIGGLFALSGAAVMVCLPIMLYSEQLLTFWVGGAIALQVSDVLLIALALVPIGVGGILSGAVLNATGKAAHLFSFMVVSHSLVLGATYAGIAIGGMVWMVFGKAVASLLTGIVLRSWTYRHVFGVELRSARRFWLAMSPGILMSVALIVQGLAS